MATNRTGPDGYPLPVDHPRHNAHLTVTCLAEAILADWSEDDPNAIVRSQYHRPKNARKVERAAVALALTERLDRLLQPVVSVADSEATGEPRLILRYVFRALLGDLLASDLAFNQSELTEFFERLSGWTGDKLWPQTISAAIGAAERVLGCRRLRRRRKGVVRSDDLVEALQRFRSVIAEELTGRDRNRFVARIDDLLECPPSDGLLSEGIFSRDRCAGVERVGPELTANSPWATRALADLAALGESERASWSDLLRFASTAKQGQPSERWLQKAKGMVDEIGDARVVQSVEQWLRLATLGGGDTPEAGRDGDDTVLKGLIWCCVGREDLELVRTLGRAAEVSFGRKKPLPAKVGNACLFVLAQGTDEEALAQLFRLGGRVRQVSTRRRIRSALEEAARRLSKDLSELEECTVPACGLTEVGSARERLGAYEAELRVSSTRAVELRWHRADGGVQRTVPAAVRRQYPDGVAKLQSAAKDLQAMVSVQRDRLEALLLSERKWQLETWRQRYLVHPLVGTIARRLIWSFELPEGLALGVWRDGKLVDVDGAPIYGFREESRVQLWHPLGFEAADVESWRLSLERAEVVQPFKQAHRELYVLTDAELATQTYSNRFAAHIVKQHQFSSLCKARGWSFDLAGRWSYRRHHAVRELPQWGLRAEFWVDAIDRADAYADSGVALYLSTDQVRFYSTEDPSEDEPRALLDVPALVFSEVMRDVDLFVGVASIDNDPGWSDQGDGTGHVDYWQNFSFGELGAAAKTRRDVLTRLLPRLKIRERSSISGRFLVVKGRVRTYKIHLGSANVLMEPNDQYLCIVKDRSPKGEKVRLPFEGDATLSMILSKAFMLAADDEIRDQTILSQIHCG